VLRPRHQVAVTEAMEQVVDGLEAHHHAEFALENPPDVAAPEGADTVLRARRGVQALLHAGVVHRVQQRRPPAAGSVMKRLDPPDVVLGDPVLDGFEGAPQGVGDVLGGPPLLGEEDGLSAAPDALLGEGTRQFLELFRGMVLGDEHR